jgi:hypothetical protein
MQAALVFAHAGSGSVASLASIGLALIQLFTLPAGCAPTIHQRETAFDEAETVSYLAQGTAQVSGRVSFKAADASVRERKRWVYLKPASGYTAEWLDHVVIQRVPFEPPDSREKAAHRSALTDGDGRFAFEQVPPGDYYLLCPIISEVPGYFGYGGGTISRTIGWTKVKLHIETGQRLNIDLSC